MNQSHKRSFIAVLIFIGFLLFMAFWGIDLILGAYAGHKLSKLAERHHLDIRYDKIRLMGLSTVRMEGLTVIPVDADTLIHADRLQAKLELGRLLLLTPSKRVYKRIICIFILLRRERELILISFINHRITQVSQWKQL